MGIFVIKFKYQNDDYHFYSATFIKDSLYDAIKQIKLDHKFSKNKPIILNSYRSKMTFKDFGFPTNSFRKLIDIIIKDQNLQYLAKSYGIHVKEFKNA